MGSTPASILGPVLCYDFCTSTDKHKYVLQASISDDGKSSFISRATVVNRESYDDDSRKSTASAKSNDSSTSNDDVTDEEGREFNWSEGNTTDLPVKTLTEHSNEIN